MKKFLFGFFALMSLGLAFRIGNILINDLDRLTNYGYGYLTGLSIVFLVFAFLTYIFGRKIFAKSNSTL